MFIPRYWSEARHVEKLPNRRQVTVRRFGWSSKSQDDAAVHARQRVEEALGVLRRDGETGLAAFKRRERRVAYAGADGLPIREEIVAEHPTLETVLTRNTYGAVCLNTTRAMFVDVDQPVNDSCLGGCLGVVVGAVLGPFVLDTNGFTAMVVGALSLALFAVLAGVVFGALKKQSRNPLEFAIARTKKWCESRSEWLVAVYETPAGARLLALHRGFDAADEATFEFMKFVSADPLYVRMCQLQKCFRARVSPKSWRAGLSPKFPSGGTWPVTDPAKLQARAAWVREYEQIAESYASCRYVETIGRGIADSRVEQVKRLHDRLSGAETDRKLA